MYGTPAVSKGYQAYANKGGGSDRGQTTRVSIRGTQFLRPCELQCKIHSWFGDHFRTIKKTNKERCSISMRQGTRQRIHWVKEEVGHHKNPGKLQQGCEGPSCNRCQPSSYWCSFKCKMVKMLLTKWARSFGHCLGIWAATHVPVWNRLWSSDRPQANGVYINFTLRNRPQVQESVRG